MKLNELFNDCSDIEIEQLSIDSRMPMKNAIFFCLNGIKYDGHDYIDEAINNGAKVIVYSNDIKTNKNVIYIRVKNVNDTLNRVANIFYDYPNNDFNEYVISGCYGRSSVSSLIKYYLDHISNCGYIGILGIDYKQTHLSTTFPALTSLDNLKIITKMKKEGVKNCVFETSPISLYYKKLDVLKPSIFVYTSTSRLSSDYLACNNQYFSNIRRYLYTLEDNTKSIFNLDDDCFEELKDSVNNYLTYGTNDSADYQICDILIREKGLSFNLKVNNRKYCVNSSLLGLVNVYNLTAAIAALNASNYDLENIIEVLSKAGPVNGVMDCIDPEYRIIIDCAYELDSLHKVLDYAKRTSKGKVIVIMAINYGDDEKRIQEMMNLFNEYVDRLILTEDESLDGEVMNILAKSDIYEGLNVVHLGFRSRAIENGINIMQKDDTLLILGKGNEDYLTLSLGKDRYLGDKFYALKYMKKRRQENEII